ncbi:putative ABC transporter ATP-binding protein [Streptomyces violarus]
MAMVFQDALSALNPVLTVGEQLAEMFVVHRGMSRKDARAKAVELMDRVRIPAARERVRQYPHQFSGGMRQRIMIAMAMALEPSLIIADEPTTALDVTVQAQVMELLAELQSELPWGSSSSPTTCGVVADVADRIAVMYAGRIVETAPVHEIYKAPAHPYTRGLLESIPRLDQEGPGAVRRSRACRPTSRASRRAAPSTPVPDGAGRVPHRCAAALRGGRAGAPATSGGRGWMHAERDESAETGGGAAGSTLLSQAREDAVTPYTEGDPILEVSGLAKHYPLTRGIVFKRHVGAVRAIDGVDFDLYAGETLGIVGGVGLRQVDGREDVRQPGAPDGRGDPLQGRGRPLSGRALKAVRRNIQMVFQDPYTSLNPRMTVGDIIGEPYEMHPEVRAEGEGGPRCRNCWTWCRAQPRVHQPLSAPVLRRPAAAHRHRARRLRSTRGSSSPTSRCPRWTCRCRRRWST